MQRFLLAFGQISKFDLQRMLGHGRDITGDGFLRPQLAEYRSTMSSSLSTTPGVVRVDVEPFDSFAGRRLVLGQQLELAILYGQDARLYAVLDAPGKPTPAEFSAEQRGAFVVARLDGRVVACGAGRRLAEGTDDSANESVAEVKRVYTVPEARGHGLARAVMQSLEQIATGFGYAAIQLETGLQQQAALTLYARMGYEPIAAWGRYVHNPIGRCFAKQLR